MAKSLQRGIVFDFDIRELKDYSGNGYNGTNSGTTLTTDQLERYQKGRKFDGTSNNITTSSDVSFVSNSPMSISAWINRDSSSNVDPVVDKYATSPYAQREYVFGFTASNLYWFGYDETNNGNRGRYAPDVSTGWHHLVGTYSGGTSASDWKIYVDGTQTDTNDVSTGTFSSMVNTARVMSIGNQTPGLGVGYFGGRIAEPKLWDRELSAEEVWQLYTDTRNNYQGIFEDCMVYLDMKKDVKDVLNNYSTTNNGATLTSDKFEIDNAAYSFDGTNDYIDVTDFPTSISGNYTFAGWILLDTTGANRTWFGWSDRPNGGSRYIESDYFTSVAGLRFAVANTGETAITTSISTDEWIFIVCTIDTSTGDMQLFSNGSLQATGTKVPAFTNNAVLYIGQLPWESSNVNPWDGNVGEFWVWNRILLSEEVQSLYDLTKNKYIYPYMKGGDK